MMLMLNLHIFMYRTIFTTILCTVLGIGMLPSSLKILAFITKHLKKIWVSHALSLNFGNLRDTLIA